MSDNATPRAYTQKEAQRIFLDHVKAAVNYWASDNVEDQTCSERLHGLAFSILCILDGANGSHPSVQCTISPHPSDKQFCIDNGKNYYEDGTDIHGSDMLHGIYYNVEGQ